MSRSIDVFRVFHRKIINLFDRINKKVSSVKLKSYLNNQLRENDGLYSMAHVTLFFGNAGDTVLSYCVRKLYCKFISIHDWKIISLRAEVTDSVIERINLCKCLIIGGGGLFLPDSNENEISGWQWAISPEKLEKISVPICIFSVGYNYFPGQIPSDLFIKSLYLLLRKAAFVGLRNRGSVKAVCGLIPEKYHNRVVFQPCTTTLLRKFIEKLPSKTITNKVAINMAFDRENIRYGDEKETILCQVAQGIRRIEKRGYKIYCVSHVPADKAFLDYLDEVQVKYKYVNLRWSYPKEIIEFYNEMDLVFGMRGHAQMIPFGVNTEIISLGSHDKMRWFLEDIDAIDWYIDLRDNPQTLANRIVEKFVDIHETNHEKTCSRLIEQQQVLWEITEQNMGKIKKVVN